MVSPGENITTRTTTNQNVTNKLHKAPHSQNYNLVRQLATSRFASHSQPPILQSIFRPEISPCCFQAGMRASDYTQSLHTGPRDMAQPTP